MESSFAAVKFVLGKIPVILKTVVFHALRLSPTCHKRTLRTELIVTILREFVANAPPSTITQQQAMFLTDRGVRGSMWVSKTTFPAPPDDLRHLLFKAIRDLGTGEEEYAKPDLQGVEGEWVGYRAGVKANTPEPTTLSERDKYENILRDMNMDITLLYFHGGSYYLMDPVSDRPLMAKYANLSGGRVFSVRYRLAPQHPFPAALLDALVAYLSLLYPPPGSFHEPIPASRIVLGGDSAGGNLASALLQTLLHIHRDVPVGETPTMTFHGVVVPVPLPGGVALSSPSMDLTRCMQGSESHATWDYLPPPSFSPAQSPPCAIWPSDPPRAELFCEGSALCHPLVSPLAAPSWAGSPPMFIVCGQERLTDECKAFAQKAAKNGVRIVWEQYEAMPHCFSQVIEGSAESEACLASWAKFVRMVAEKPDEVATRGEFITARTMERRSVDVYSLLDLSEKEIFECMQRGRQAIVDRFNAWRG
ncbi:Acetyl-hydrolase [Madurella mycetomatis]|uniref:Acetyl-hydrolase n=1 Tax=Madurella mycetomatis TaxID=100816 RepID=A0A175W5V7_9PEZI|nr:Acetyl-hydrolase [Madurella mycetomatis]